MHFIILVFPQLLFLILIVHASAINLAKRVSGENLIAAGIETIGMSLQEDLIPLAHGMERITVASPPKRIVPNVLHELNQMTPLMRHAYEILDEQTFLKTVNAYFQDPAWREMMASLFNLRKWVRDQKISGLLRPSPADMPSLIQTDTLINLDPILLYNYLYLEETAFNARMASLKVEGKMSERFANTINKLFHIRSTIYKTSFGEIDHAIDGNTIPVPAVSTESAGSSRSLGDEEVSSGRNGGFIYMGGRLNRVRNGRITKTVARRRKDPQEHSSATDQSSS